MSGNIPPITQGLGKFTPDVWRRMSDSIYETEESQGRRPPSRENDQGIVTFPAKITGYQVIDSVSGSDFTNPKRQYLYTWQEVSLQFSVNAGLTIDAFTGGRTSGAVGDADFVPAINGSEVGVPSSRSGSFLGINLEQNSYPPVAMMPSVNGDEVNNCGEVNLSGSSNGPLVLLNILRCKTDAEPGTGLDKQLSLIAFFYSSFELDGCCASE